MRRLPIILSAALSVPAVADEAQLVPLENYIAQPGVDKDPAAIGYVMTRCSALYTVFAKMLEVEIDPERQKAKAQNMSTGERFMGFAVQMMMHRTTIELKDALLRTQKLTVALGNIYIDRITEAHVSTNNMFDDPLITGDFTVCKGLLEKM